MTSSSFDKRGSRTHLPKLIPTSLVCRTHLDDESNSTEEDSVITILNEGFGFGDEVVDEVRDFADDSKSAQGSLRFRMKQGNQLLARTQSRKLTEAAEIKKTKQGRVDEPSFGCRCLKTRGASRSRCRDLSTSPRTRCWRTCRERVPRRTCWSGSCR